MLTKFFSYQFIEIINLVITSQFFILLIIGASLRRKNIIPIIGSSLLVLADIIGMVMSYTILLAAIRLLTPMVLLTISIVAFAKRKSKLNKFLGILPFLLYFTTELISIIVFSYMYSIPIYTNLLSNILSLIFVGGLYLLIGLLLVKNPPSAAENTAYQYTAPAAPMHNTYNPAPDNYYTEPSQPAQPTQSFADEIIKLKSLMDQGIITPEEFEAKKKELLNI